MSSIRSILEKLVYQIVGPRCKTKDTDEFEYKDGDSRCAVCTMYEQVDQALKDISELIIPKISDIDRLYTDEYDRKLWNEFKHEVQSNLKEALK